MEADRMLSYLGLSRRAGKLSCGHDAALSAVRSGRARLCMLASDASPRLVEEFEGAVLRAKRKIPLLRPEIDMAHIGFAVSLRSAVLTVDDEGLASQIIKIYNSTYGEDTI